MRHKFTNFTRDHLDFHRDMADYWVAKRALFAWRQGVKVVASCPDPPILCVCACACVWGCVCS